MKTTTNPAPTLITNVLVPAGSMSSAKNIQHMRAEGPGRVQRITFNDVTVFEDLTFEHSFVCGATQGIELDDTVLYKHQPGDTATITVSGLSCETYDATVGGPVSVHMPKVKE